MTFFVTTRSFLFYIILLYSPCSGSKKTSYKLDSGVDVEGDVVSERCRKEINSKSDKPAEYTCVWAFVNGRRVGDVCPEYGFGFAHVKEEKAFCSYEDNIATCICDKRSPYCFRKFKNTSMGLEISKEIHCIQERWIEFLTKRGFFDRKLIKAKRAALKTTGSTSSATLSTSKITTTTATTTTTTTTKRRTSTTPFEPTTTSPSLEAELTTTTIATMKSRKSTTTIEQTTNYPPLTPEDLQTTEAETTEGVENEELEKVTGNAKRPKYVYKNSTAFMLSIIGCYACTFLVIQIIATAILGKIQQRHAMKNLVEMVKHRRK